VLAIYDGMCGMNIEAIRTMDFDWLCLFAGDWPDLSAFEGLSDRIEKLSINSAGICDFDNISALKELRYLRIGDGLEPAKKGQKIDFKAFLKLEQCQLSWKKYFTPALLDCPKLRSLTLWHCPAKDLELLSSATQLTTLDLIQGSLVDLRGIEHMQSLRNLTLANLRNLSDLTAISELHGLRHLCISACSKVEELTAIYPLYRLEVLHVDGKFVFEDLEFLRHFPALKELIFECQLKKHDFAPLFELPALRLGRFISLRDFVAKPEELQELARIKRRELNLELFGGGKIKTATFEFSA
jgi:hypothetical protein